MCIVEQVYNKVILSKHLDNITDVETGLHECNTHYTYQT